MMEQIVFQDTCFEKAVREVVEKTKKALCSEDLLKITSIIIEDGENNVVPIPWQSDGDAFNMCKPQLFFNAEDSENGEWISDLRLFPHLKALHIYSHTESLDVLYNLTMLSELYIYNSSNTDWDFIESLTGLHYLYIRNCDFKDLTPIKNLCIKQQDVYEQTKKDKNADLLLTSRLSNLALVYCGIEDITPLSYCRAVHDLNLSHNAISDLNPLSKLLNVYYLTLRHNKIKNIEPLKDLKWTYYISLRHNEIEDISVFNKFKYYYIGRLFLEYNPIKDYSPLKNVSVVISDVEQYTKKAAFIGGQKVSEDEDEGGDS